ncbi:MAG: GDP-mannose 4,6-dehydratase [Chlamydiae bacterium]|nr:GDP-mannose 4,6-dehydratase [Chlamydiota bacterium]
MSKQKPLLLISGVSGRIGSRAARHFSRNFQVVGLDIFEPSESCGECDFLFTDISSRENVQDTFHQISEKYGKKIAGVIHLAAYYNFAGGSWEKYEAITIGGTKNLLEALKEFEVEQFLFSSTILVYAPCKLGEKIDEDSPLDPKWEYPLSKVKTEALIAEQEIPGVILRIAGIYDDVCHSIPLSQQIARINEKKIESHLFPGNPKHGATFLHMDDLIHVMQIILDKRRALGECEIFVLGEEEVMCYRELQDEMGRLLHGKPWRTIQIPKWVAKMGAFLQDKLPFIQSSFIKPWMIDLADDHYDVDIHKAREVLGWEPVHALKNCLPKMVGALKKDPQKWYEEHGL